MTKTSLYVEAGSPTRCQNEACSNLFDGSCWRGDNDRYYCSELCAQIGMELDFDRVVKLPAKGSGLASPAVHSRIKGARGGVRQ